LSREFPWLDIYKGTGTLLITVPAPVSVP